MNDKIYLVGDTGFVGSNLLRAYSGFPLLANSKTVKHMYGGSPDVLVYAGVTGTKWYACNHEKEDAEVIKHAEENIFRIRPKKLILISTVDVYDTLEDVDESHENDFRKLCVYGKHRLLLEEWVKENVNDYMIVRLPAIYGENLKKNFIYDMCHFIPKILTEDKIREIEDDIRNIRTFYDKDEEGLYHLIQLPELQYQQLKHKFRNIKNNALMFTNSSSEYQFYNLKHLWYHIWRALEHEIKIVNLVTEPVSAGDVYSYVYHQEFQNNSVGEIKYHLKSNSSFPMVGRKKYFYTKEEVLKDLKDYILLQSNPIK